MFEFLLRIDNLLFFDVSLFQKHLFFRRVGGEIGKNSAPIFVIAPRFLFLFLPIVLS